MTVTMNLEADEAAALTEQAEVQGVDIETVLHRLVAFLPPPSAPQSPLTQKQQAALALLDSWTAEKEQMTSEELAESDAEFAELQANINRWRAEEGREPAFS